MIKVDFKENILLAPLTTFRIGGPAAYFCEISNFNELREAIIMAKKIRKPFFILGGGSNLLVSDDGFNGVIIKFVSKKMKVYKNADETFIEVDAGVLLANVLQKTLEFKATGLEWGAGIPGTIGGAIFGNCGAYGKSISESIKKVTVLNPNNFEIKELSKENCEFDYRSSIFKRNGYIILSAQLNFKNVDNDEPRDLVLQYLKERKEKIPSYPSAGCIFKNIPAINVSPEILKKIPQDKIKGGKIAVGYLIDQCGLKGKRIGGAQISSMHANFIVNLENATAKDVYELIKLSKKSVFEKFGIKLEEEIRYLGQFN